ncbi:hypothetical protein EDD65_1233 [Keratinibaculum paraultunense]|uniref:Uncharacterized protein n=1 Tax=Keratinibaculum paraultunense TaxID=1278232 RepID=A0A4R3KN61_9FIRM|nr:hypothetical protein [Keratinibaculum paraultunense]QQY80382.1 hypothetical protein JL105_03370 [Keratinibaculum paraultunense]TCS85385.1 hypothetical protein EDD65_1233 [Keratinibaculum paraultunense]
MNLIKDFLLVNKSTMKKSVKSFKKNWILVFTGLIYTILNILLLMVLNTFFRGPLYILVGFIMAIVSSSLISNYLYLLSNIINYDRITMENFKEGFKYYLWKIYGVFFIAWIVDYLLSMISGIVGASGYLLNSLIKIIILIALNPLPETIYQKYYSSFESIQYAFNFMKENWFNWLLPNIILYLFLYLITGKVITDLFTTHLSFGLSLSFKELLKYILGQVLFSFIMIYRGHLFKLLSTSTRRKRMYTNKFYD